jgi:hypothetical protein
MEGTEAPAVRTALRRDHRSRPVVGTPVAGGSDIHCDSVSDVKAFGFSRSHVADCLAGRLTSTGGYTWKYRDKE